VNWINTDTIPHFEITFRSAVDTAENIDGKKITQVLNITSFDSGRWQMPPFELLVDGQPFYTDSITISVNFTPFNPEEDYRDIKDIIEVVNPMAKYYPWMVAAMAAVSLAMIIVLMLRRKKPAATVSKPSVPLLTPYEEAMTALRTLGKNPPAKEEIKYYYSQLNDILRNYVSRQLRVPAFERTNEELILQLSALNIPRDSFTQLAQSLRMSDFVKFAKYLPGETDNRSNLEIVRSTIETLDKKIPGAV
jgi:hypothetical protein